MSRGHYPAPCGEPHDNFQDYTSHAARCDACKGTPVTLVTSNGRGSFHTFTVPADAKLAHGFAYASKHVANRAAARSTHPDVQVIESIDTDRPTAYALTTTKETTTP